MNQQAIGFFDSGIGGISVWKEVTKLLPNENTIYLADTQNAPYGVKSKEKIIELCIKNTELLLNYKCKIIIIACNTATTNAINVLRSKYKDVNFIGIEPAIKPASIKTKTKKVGVLATTSTLASEVFKKTSLSLKDVEILEQDGNGLVELIESGKCESPEMSSLLKSYINPMLEQNIDYLVLGCTHYPFLKKQIKRIVGDNITILDSGFAVAKQTKKILAKTNNLKIEITPTKHYFYSNSTETELIEGILTNIPNILVSKLDF